MKLEEIYSELKSKSIYSNHCINGAKLIKIRREVLFNLFIPKTTGYVVINETSTLYKGIDTS